MAPRRKRYEYADPSTLPVGIGDGVIWDAQPITVEALSEDGETDLLMQKLRQVYGTPKDVPSLRSK